nr:predicted GPI-anchored protein 58 [Aegilops tauschii subsp. strangulata]
MARPRRRPRLHHNHRGVDCVADVPASHAPRASSRSGVCVGTSPRRMTPQPCARDAPSPASARFRWRPACPCTAEWLLLCPRPYVRAFAAAPPVSACRQADAAVPGAFVRLHALHLRLTTCTAPAPAAPGLRAGLAPLLPLTNRPASSLACAWLPGRRAGLSPASRPAPARSPLPPHERRPRSPAPRPAPAGLPLPPPVQVLSDAPASFSASLLPSTRTGPGPAPPHTRMAPPAPPTAGSASARGRVTRAGSACQPGDPALGRLRLASPPARPLAPLPASRARRLRPLLHCPRRRGCVREGRPRLLLL